MNRLNQRAAAPRHCSLSRAHSINPYQAETYSECASCPTASLRSYCVYGGRWPKNWYAASIDSVFMYCVRWFYVSHRRESPLIELSEEFSSTRAYSLFVSQRIERRMYTPCLPRVAEIGGAQSSFAAMCVCATTTRRVYDGQRGSFAINFAFDSRADCIDAAIACAACRRSAYKHIA